MSSATPATDLLDLAASAPAGSSASRVRDFYELTKPRMNALVVTTTAVGYYMAASHGTPGWSRLINTLLGTAMCAAGASVLNQLIERHRDALMPRTQNRPLVTQRIQPTEAAWMGVLLGIVGTAYLAFAVNLLTAALGAFTLLTYVMVYTPMKRRTWMNTLVGAIPGAVPPMMGFTAVTGRLTWAAAGVFGILFFWQLPHFYAIAVLYRDDYAAGGFKMLPVIDPQLKRTSRQMVLFGLALVPVSVAPALVGIDGWRYVVTAVMLGLAFLSFGFSCAETRSREDARKLFFASIIYLPLLLAAMMLDKQ